jgi:tetratricopeptide (TPR) repeat protein
LAKLRSSDAIEFLGLSETALTDAGVAELPRFSGVTFVTLADTPITDRSVASLSKMTQLQGLNIKGTRITAEGVSKLHAALPACKVVADANPIDPAVTFQRESATIELGPPTLIAPPGPEPQPLNGPQLASASLSREAQRWEDAALPPEQRLEQLLSQRLLEPEVLEALGDVAAEDGNWPQAVASYRAAVEMAPEDKPLRFKLGTVLAEAGDVDEARGQFMLSVGPAAAHYNLAVIHQRRGRDFESLESLRNSLAWDESFEPAQRLLVAHSSVEPAPLPRTAPPPAGPTPLDLLLASFRSPATRPAAGPWEVVIEPYARADQRTPDAEASAILPSSHQSE